MNIVIGKLVENKTLDYLFPILRIYGSTFLAKFNLTHKLAYGIHDCVLDGTPFEKQRKICMLIDRKSRPNLYEDFIRWIRLQEYYITDYSHDHTHTGRMQMVIIEIPEEHSKVYDSFLKSKYSKMYPSEDVNKYFVGTPTLGIMKRTSERGKEFVSLVNERYKTILGIEDLDKDSEYDFPWEKQNEFFNYRENQGEAY